MEANGRYLPDDGVQQLANEFDMRPHASAEDRNQLFKEVYADRNGYSETDFQDFHTAIAALHDIGHAAEAAGLERYIAGRVRKAAEGNTTPVVSSGPVQFPPTATYAEASFELPFELRPHLTDDQDLAYKHDAVLSINPRVQRGEVLDRVVHDGTVFYRRRDGVRPEWADGIRVQADRPLSDDEAEHLAGLLGYARAKHLRGEPFSDIERDSPYSFVFGTDMTKSRSDDIGMAMERWEDSLPDLIENGSDLRTSNNKGPGTKGTRAIDGFGANAPRIELYYDSVTTS